MRGEFTNETYLDFSAPDEKARMERAIADVASRLGETYDIVIGGERVRTKQTFSSYNPGNPEQVIGVFQRGTKEEVERAVGAAAETFESWRWTPPEERAQYLFRMAEVARERRRELASWQIYEVGKSWPEADADVAEAIDFMEFYGREMIRLSGRQPLVKIPSEENELKYIPLGVGAVIPPWNFPFAILVGMCTASMVAGNTVVLKPSSDSPAIAAQFMRLVEEVGVPPGVVNFLTGGGGSIGDALVGHPRVRFISFTGSKEVGLHINELAAKTPPGQKWIKRVVAEMGGKDAIIVDDETDLDTAAKGVTASAFGFQGQKCSACSRAIVVEKVYDTFVEKLVEQAKKITVGPVTDPANRMGPVINRAAMESILEYIEIGSKEGRLVLGGERASGDGYFIQPTIIVDVPREARIAQEEIFGPVLAVIKARDFDDALAVANDTDYGLTGAVYTTNEEKIEKAREVFHCGNLYINRKCTGALVGVHPFGGFNMSGTDSKAGGRDYLLLFTQAKVVSAFVGKS
ncbi:1-pyrroline-5-carboxylate dehydrogenase [candidate division TA06 bacterium DG_24]|uniref:L-glutamate gamma-semialdehyde dehydrogenase n=1 Tax=candidate division TA06 bacterium DG_24 TaxID=1703770 RepID=A0A0S7WTR9_UNCT6|nr:MAG: 1-pyrroline-5-carboxylate dehydrogenase [candidate division TA06 bacterium DG_24]